MPAILKNKIIINTITQFILREQQCIYLFIFLSLLNISRNKDIPMGGVDSIKSYLNMLASCRLACEVSNTDITEFFDRWGFS